MSTSVPPTRSAAAGKPKPWDAFPAVTEVEFQRAAEALRRGDHDSVFRVGSENEVGACFFEVNGIVTCANTTRAQCDCMNGYFVAGRQSPNTGG